MRARLLPLIAAALIAAAPAPDVDRGGPITPADIMSLKDVREVEISPDGRTILFTVQAQMSTFSPEHSTIWSVPADGSAAARPFIISAGADGGPRWSPDGKRVAFLSNRKNPLTGGRDTGFDFKVDIASTPGRPAEPAPPPASPATSGEPSRQLWLMPVTGGEAVPLTALPGDVSEIAWSPDGTRIAFLSADPDTPEEKAAKAAKRDWTVVDESRHMTRLWLLDLRAHSAHRLSPADLNVEAIDWSPDGRTLALRVTGSTSINDAFYHSRAVIIDAATGAVGPTIYDHVAEGPRWSPDGRALLVDEILSPGFIGLAPRVIDVASRRVERLGDDHPGLLTQLRWAPDGHSVLALSFERTRSKLVRIDRRSGAVSPLAGFDGEAADFTASKDGKRFAIAANAPSVPAGVWSMAGGRTRLVTEVNPQVVRWRLGDVREVSWRNSRDGHIVYGVLVTPPGLVAGTPVKLVVQGHGGPEWAWWSGWQGSWHEWAQLLATHGYAVLLPNPRGSDGQGTAFARAVGGDWGGMDFQDVVDGVDMLVRDKIADPDRIGIGGWSYGGYLAAWAVTHDRRFKAAVVGAGPTDMVAMARVTDTPDFPLGYFGDLEGHLADYRRASPALSVSAVQAPVLVLDGEADTRVPATLGLEFYRGLRMLGKPAVMVRYPREPHWFHEAAHQEDVQRRVLDWFDRYL
ncbi:alpha/beta fold hydrolase [Sphingomonas sp.]|uniref:S9 family peptidase n=1 Tax=Sphingomonas sp. TaxID=28214 RepID=UPI003B000C70